MSVVCWGGGGGGEEPLGGSLGMLQRGCKARGLVDEVGLRAWLGSVGRV